MTCQYSPLCEFTWTRTDTWTYVYARWYSETPPWDPLHEDGTEDPLDPVGMVLWSRPSDSHTWHFRRFAPSIRLRMSKKRQERKVYMCRESQSVIALVSFDAMYHMYHESMGFFCCKVAIRVRNVVC